MEDYPKTMSEFQKRFSNEENCLQYLAQMRWPEGFRCPRCQHEQAWVTGRGLYICRACRFQASLTAGTIFQDTRKPMQQWFQAMWYVTNQKQGVSALGLQRTLGLGSYHTAWTWLHKLRRAMVRPGRDRLSGMVEVDETFIGGLRTGRRGRGAAGKALVLVAAEETKAGHIGRIRLQRIPDASMLTLHGAIQACIAPGSTVRTDGWSGYNELKMLGYARLVARTEAIVGDGLLPLANRVASLLKRWLLGTHQGAVQTSHLEYYLDEFTFRFNRRTSRSRGKLFYRLVEQAIKQSPVTGDLIKGGTGDQ